MEDKTFDPAHIGAELGFTPDELLINRGGALSDRQRVLLQARPRGLGGLLGRRPSERVREVVGAARTRARRAPALPDPGYAGGMRYELTIGKTTFLVRSQGVLDAFTDGGSYRAYYASGGGRFANVLLSAERIG